MAGETLSKIQKRFERYAIYDAVCFLGYAVIGVATGAAVYSGRGVGIEPALLWSVVGAEALGLAVSGFLYKYNSDVANDKKRQQDGLVRRQAASSRDQRHRLRRS